MGAPDKSRAMCVGRSCNMVGNKLNLRDVKFS